MLGKHSNCSIIVKAVYDTLVMKPTLASELKLRCVVFDNVSADSINLCAHEVDSVTVSDQPFVKEVLSRFGKLLLSFLFYCPLILAAFCSVVRTDFSMMLSIGAQMWCEVLSKTSDRHQLSVLGCSMSSPAEKLFWIVFAKLPCMCWCCRSHGSKSIWPMMSCGSTPPLHAHYTLATFHH